MFVTFFAGHVYDIVPQSGAVYAWGWLRIQAAKVRGFVEVGGWVGLGLGLGAGKGWSLELGFEIWATGM